MEQGNTTEYLGFLMVSSEDHITGVTGLVDETGFTLIEIAKNGGDFGAPAVGTIIERDYGWYDLVPNATDADTIGPLKLHAEAPGCDPTDREFVVVAGTTAHFIEGTITHDVTGAPLENVEVYVSASDDMSSPRQATTNAQGYFKVYLPNAGTYYVQKSEPGYEVSAIEEVAVT